MPLKVYRRHSCARQHRTWNTLARCMWPRAVWAAGDGPFASVSWYPRGPSVGLHETALDATNAVRFIDAYGLDCVRLFDRFARENTHSLRARRWPLRGYEHGLTAFLRPDGRETGCSDDLRAAFTEGVGSEPCRLAAIRVSRAA